MVHRHRGAIERATEHRDSDSMSSYLGSPGNAPYACSKAAVDALSDVLRQELSELKYEIGVTVLFPGPVQTAILESEENLRRPGDRSRERTVVPYDRLPIPSEELEQRSTFVEASTVGEMALRAVEAGAPYCVTHRPINELIERRARDLISAYVPIAES
jgi:short-subunit dehydrogenase